MLDEKTAAKILEFMPYLNEKQKRLYLASEARSLGRGGISAISKVTGVSRATISSGIAELENKETSDETSENDKRQRRIGGGRKSIKEIYPNIMTDIESIVEDHTFGDPQSPLKWTTKSLRNIADELNNKGYKIGYRKVGYLLHEMGYSLQMNQKMEQVGTPHEDRNAQFMHINETAKEFLAANEPVISIDCKKKENIGNFKNVGSEYCKKGEPKKVLDHDFPISENGKASPYGIYDIGANNGFVNVGISHDTAEFAANSILMWWQEMGKERYSSSQRILITADGGGINGVRNRLWKTQLQRIANGIGKEIYVCHFPPGTSKWNKIEHRLFSQITKNWRGKPLTTLEVIVNLIAATTTETGLTVKCKADHNEYQTGKKVSDEDLKMLNIIENDFHPEWNYSVLPIV